MRVTRNVVLMCIAATMWGCGSTPEEKMLTGIVGTTIAASRTPSNEIEQIYYLGIFDPQEQLPEAVYRIRVHGQASAMSRTKFASGWVPAGLIDSLGTALKQEPNGTMTNVPALQTGRRMMMFGPEGMRESPRDHRLVMVMGADPSAFFSAIDQTLGTVAGAIDAQRNSTLQIKIIETLAQTSSERERLQAMMLDIIADFPDERGAP